MPRVRDVLMALAMAGCGSLLTYRPVRPPKVSVQPTTQARAEAANGNAAATLGAPATIREGK